MHVSLILKSWSHNCSARGHRVPPSLQPSCSPGWRTGLARSCSAPVCPVVPAPVLSAAASSGWPWSYLEGSLEHGYGLNLKCPRKARDPQHGPQVGAAGSGGKLGEEEPRGRRSGRRGVPSRGTRNAMAGSCSATRSSPSGTPPEAWEPRLRLFTDDDLHSRKPRRPLLRQAATGDRNTDGRRGSPPAGLRHVGGWGPRTCTSSKFSGETQAPVSGPH